MVANKVCWVAFALVGICVLWLGTSLARQTTELTVVRLCTAGKLAESCKQILNTPDQEGSDQNGHRIWIWKSGSKLSANADMAVISKDGIIVEVLDLDMEAGKRRIRDVYLYSR